MTSLRPRQAGEDLIPLPLIIFPFIIIVLVLVPRIRALFHGFLLCLCVLFICDGFQSCSISICELFSSRSSTLLGFHFVIRTLFSFFAFASKFESTSLVCAGIYNPTTIQPYICGSPTHTYHILPHPTSLASALPHSHWHEHVHTTYIPPLSLSYHHCHCHTNTMRQSSSAQVRVRCAMCDSGAWSLYSVKERGMGRNAYYIIRDYL